jgi:hypothetical protein
MLCLAPAAGPAAQIHEEQGDAVIDHDIAERSEHAVAVIGREGDRAAVEAADEAGAAALVGHVGPPLAVRRRQEEHGAGLDEGDIPVGQVGVHRDLFQPIRDATAVESVLKLAVTVVVHGPTLRCDPDGRKGPCQAVGGELCCPAVERARSGPSRRVTLASRPDSKRLTGERPSDH